MRYLLLALVLTAPCGCASDQYTRLPEPTGPWEPANADMHGNDNNLVPRPLASVLPPAGIGPAPSSPPVSAPVTPGGLR